MFAALLMSNVFADDQKTITVVLTSTSGVRNNLMRLLTDQIQKSKPEVKFVYASHPGAAELIGFQYLASQAPTGDKIGAFSVNALNSMAILNEKDLKVSVDKLSFVSHLAQTPTVIIANNRLQINSPKEFMTYVRNSVVTVGGSGVSSLPYWLYIVDTMGINPKNLQYINYKDTTSGILDVVGNRIEFSASNVSDAAAMIRDGRVKVVGLASRQRLAAFPDLPLIPDYIPGATYAATWALALPPGSTAKQVKFFQDMFVPALNRTDTLKFLDDGLMQSRPELQTPEAVVKYMLALRKKWRPYILPPGSQ